MQSPFWMGNKWWLYKKLPIVCNSIVFNIPSFGCLNWLQPARSQLWSDGWMRSPFTAIAQSQREHFRARYYTGESESAVERSIINGAPFPGWVSVKSRWAGARSEVNLERFESRPVTHTTPNRLKEWTMESRCHGRCLTVCASVDGQAQCDTRGRLKWPPVKKKNQE